MADKTAIEWTDATWTPIRARRLVEEGGVAHLATGWHCVHVSEGCRNCYAEAMNKRLGTGLEFKPGNLKELGGEATLFLDEEMLLAPLRWKKPRKIFVGSMTDLFADFVPDAWIDRVFSVMALAPQHTFQVLTKRAKRMREYFASVPLGLIGRNMADVLNETSTRLVKRWPLPNVWLGVSAERQPEADERIPELLATPAAVHFVSAEPLLAEIDFRNLHHGETLTDALDGMSETPVLDAGDRMIAINPKYSTHAKLDLVITGGESGPNARTVPRAAFLSIRDQCAAAGVAYFHKQNGEWIDADEYCLERIRMTAVNIMTGARLTPLNFEDAAKVAAILKVPFGHQSDGSTLIRVGKRRAGRRLDGVEHNAFPAPESQE